MLKTRLLALVAALTVGFTPMMAAGQVNSPVYRSGGVAAHATGVICLNLDGSSCVFGGGAGASSTATAASPTRVEGAVNQAQSQDLHGSTRILNMDSSGNALDPNAPTNCGPTATFIQCATKAGQPTLDANGAPVIPESAAPVVTKTTLVANTSTAICPTATHPVTTEIYLNTAPANLGLGLKGQSLSTDVWGTGSTTADLVLTAAGQYYSSPVAYSTAITARSTGTPNVTCVQTLRQ